MDEYYCPNCNAILNDQIGFDPSKGSWTCRACGKFLYDWDDDGECYPGVGWYCDECGALLNSQTGFYDGCDTWTCTECYHENIISEDEIYESEEDYKAQKIADSVVGTIFSIADMISSVANAAKSLPDDEETENDDLCQDNSIVAAQDFEQLSDAALRRIRFKARLFKKKNIDIDYSSNELIGRPVEEVKMKLRNNAFIKIAFIPIKDIYVGSDKKVDEVESVIIAGRKAFAKGEKFPYDSEIQVNYHEKRVIEIPFALRSLRKMNYLEVEDTFRQLGFTNVRENPIRDLVTGWITKDGTIEKITVAGQEKVKAGTVFEYDVEIVVDYHTKKSKH